MPDGCRQDSPANAKSAQPRRTRQLSFDDVAEDVLPSQPIPEEEVPPEGESEGDFTSLEDVLREIKEAENA